MSYTGTNPKFDSTVLRDLLSTTPVNPPSGYLKRLLRYGKSYLRSALGVESQIGKGEGRNYCLSPSVYIPAATSSDLGWFASGGSVSNITAGLPRDSSLSAIQFISTSTGDYLRYRFKADDADISIAKRLQILFSEIQIFGDYKLEVYSGTDAALSSPLLITIQSIFTDASGITSLPGGTLDVLTNFDTTSRQFYEVRWTSLAGSKTLKLSDVSIGLPDIGAAAALSKYISWSPIFGSGMTAGPTNVSLAYKVLTDAIHVTGRFTLNSVGTGLASVSFPNGWTGSKPAGAGAVTQFIVGNYRRNSAAGSAVKRGCISYIAGDSFFTFGYDDYNSAISPDTTLNGASLGNASDTIWIDAIIPITQLANNSSLNTINPIAQSPIRAGTIMAFAGATTPAGWLDCDGTVYAQNQYPQLYTQLLATWATCTNPLTGSAYSAPSAGNFRVPDLRGAFIRGAGGPNAAGIVTSLAGYQTDNMANHNHGITVNAVQTTDYNRYGSNSPSTVGQPPGIDFNTQSHQHTATSGVQVESGNETRPDNVGVRYIIKAWDESFNTAGMGGLAQSDRMGWVAPRKGQTALTVTSSIAGWTTVRAQGIYYQDQDGNHRLKFNIVGTISPSVTLNGGTTITIGAPTAVTFKNVANFEQPCSAFNSGSSPLAYAFTNPNTGTIGVSAVSSTGVTRIGVSGDVELESKPAWA